MTDITIILPLPSYSEAQDAAYVRTIESIKKLVDVTPTIIAVGDAASNNHLKTLLPAEWDTTLLNVKNTTLQYEVGKAVKEVKTDYFFSTVVTLASESTSFWNFPLPFCLITPMFLSLRKITFALSSFL